MPPFQIFLSHSEGDKAIASALQTLLQDIFGAHVEVVYSSDQSSQGGVRPGELWRQWIDQHIEEAKMTVVMLTPISCASAWVLWEAGAAYGVASRDKKHGVVPLTFGLAKDDIPGPFTHQQMVKGDTEGAGGILRLLQLVNEALGAPLPKHPFELSTKAFVPRFIDTVTGAITRRPLDLLDAVPTGVPTTDLSGLWVTTFDFVSGGVTKYHVDIAQITAVTARRLAAMNYPPEPVTEGHRTPFRNRVQAEIIGRHLIGQWRNVSDARYYGTVHLAVLTEESIMEGHYTSLANDVEVQKGAWRWVRLDPASVKGVDLGKMELRDPSAVRTMVTSHRRGDSLITLGMVAQSKQ